MDEYRRRFEHERKRLAQVGGTHKADILGHTYKDTLTCEADTRMKGLWRNEAEWHIRKTYTHTQLYSYM